MTTIGGMEQWVGGQRQGATTTWVNARHLTTLQVVDDPEKKGVQVIGILADQTDVYLARFDTTEQAEAFVASQLAAAKTN